MTSIKRSTMLSLGCGALLALALGSVAFATHIRPGGGSPFRVPLVVAYNQCGGAPTLEDPAPHMVVNSTHVAPLANPSCTHATQAAGTVRKNSTLTATPTGALLSTVRLDVICTGGGQTPPCTDDPTPDQEDIAITSGSITSVLCVAAGSGPSGGCSGPGAGYSGLLLAQSVIRITDHSNPTACTTPSGAGCGTGTVEDLTFTVPLSCSAGTCGPAFATINSMLPGTVKELQRGNVEIQNVRVKSCGPDWNCGAPPFAGTGDEEKFLAQGIFLP